MDAVKFIGIVVISPSDPFDCMLIGALFNIQNVSVIKVLILSSTPCGVFGLFRHLRLLLDFSGDWPPSQQAPHTLVGCVLSRADSLTVYSDVLLCNKAHSQARLSLAMINCLSIANSNLSETFVMYSC